MLEYRNSPAIKEISFSFRDVELQFTIGQEYLCRSLCEGLRNSAGSEDREMRILYLKERLEGAVEWTRDIILMALAETARTGQRGQQAEELETEERSSLL